MWLPNWLYERLPVLYLIAGAVCLWLLGVSFPSTLSTVLLLAASMLTFSFRRNARSVSPPTQRRQTGRR